MTSGGDATRRLREAVDAFAADRAPELVEEAAAEAHARVKRVLAEVMAESLLAESRRVLTPPPAAEPPRPDGEAQYVYGIVSARAEIPDDLAGIDPHHEVSLVREGDLAALASPVSLAEFGEEALHENLNDVGWLEEKARAHEHVLDVALRGATVVPLRLCTIYNGSEQVRAMLAEERAVMADALDRLDGRAEWGVKAIAEPGALDRAAARSAGPGREQGDAPRGTAYMDRRRREARSRVAAEEIAADWAAAIHDPLADAAAEALSNPLQRPEISGHEGDMLLNGVYLVDDAAIAEFSALVDRLAGEYRPLGLAVELTGPWPAYNFVESPIGSAR